MTFSIHRMLGRFSVRHRIIALAAIPVIGFLLNGIAFTVGEFEVGRASQTTGRAAALADSSQDLKSALASMRIHSRDFGARPSEVLARQFDTDHTLALNSLAALNAAVEGEQRMSLAP